MPTPPGTDEPIVDNLRLVRGDTLVRVWQLLGENEAGEDEAYDLTDVVGECQVRSEPGGTLVLSPEVTITDAADGEFMVRSEGEDTAPLRIGRYRYAVRLAFTDGTVSTIAAGTLDVLPSTVS